MVPADSALALAFAPSNRTVIHSGTNLGLWSQIQLPDSDVGGVANAKENNAPNSGDSNGDRMKDALQGDVGSNIVLNNRLDARSIPRGSLGGSFTSDVQSTGATCQQFNSVLGGLSLAVRTRLHSGRPALLQ